MKLSHIFLKATLALTTFLTGALATPYFFELFPPKVTLCQLAQNPEFYRGRLITVEADARAFGAVLIEDPGCAADDAWASVRRAEGYEPGADVEKLYSDSETEVYQARILVTGRYEPNAVLGCFGPKAVIEATRIELLSEITADPRRPGIIE